MQPEPALYLQGAYRVLLDLVDSGRVSDPAVVLALRRVGETLSQTLLRMDGLAALLANLRSRQDALINEIFIALHTRGIERVAALPASRASAEEQDIRAYDERAWAISLNLRKLAAAREDSSVVGQDNALHDLFRRACDLEGVMRAAYRGARFARNAASSRIGPETAATPNAEEIQGYLRTLPGARDVRVSNIRQLTGINTKDIVFFDVTGMKNWPSAVVMRKMRGFNANPLTSMQHEFGLLNTLHAAGVPVPRALAVDESGTALGHPLIVMEKLPGAASLPGVDRASIGAERGRALGEQIAQHLARIHSIEISRVARATERDLPRSEAIRQHFERYYRIWRETQMEPSATLEHGFVWMMENLAQLDDSFTLVHGDLDFRNIMFDGNHVSAILDWERSHLGHPAEDLAYVRGDIERIMNWDEFLDAYRRHGGRETSASALNLFHIWGYLFKASCATALALEGYANGKFSDFLLASTAFIEGEDWSDATRRLLAEIAPSHRSG